MGPATEPNKAVEAIAAGADPVFARSARVSSVSVVCGANATHRTLPLPLATWGSGMPFCSFIPYLFGFTRATRPLRSVASRGPSAEVSQQEHQIRWQNQNTYSSQRIFTTTINISQHYRQRRSCSWSPLPTSSRNSLSGAACSLER